MIIILIQSLSILIMVVLSSLFASSESAIFSIPFIRVVKLKEDGVKNADILYKLMRKPQDLLLTILIGDFVFVAFFSALMTSLMIKVANIEYLPIIMVAFSLSIVLFKDIIPMAIANRLSERFALWIARFLYVSDKIFYPIKKSFNFITRRIFRITTYIEEISHSLSIEEISHMVEVGVEEGFIDEEEHRFIDGIVDIDDETIDEVMTPRVSFISLSEAETVSEAIDLIKRTGYSRLPVFSGEKGNITGILNVMDLLRFRDSPEKSVGEIARKPMFVPENVGLIELLRSFKNSKRHLAFVIDEYGTVIGLITLDDILEEIFGEIMEPHDIFHFKCRRLDEDSFIVSGRIEIEEFEKLAGIKIGDIPVNTLGGYVINEIGRIPEEGEEFEMLGFRIKVLSSEPNVIKRMLIERIDDG